jgi:adenylate cyclase
MRRTSGNRRSREGAMVADPPEAAPVSRLRHHTAMDIAEEGLLDGLDGAEREARERLITWLLDDGFTLEDVRAAIAEDRLVLLPVERILGGTFTAAEVEERTGLPQELLLRTHRGLGLPEAGPEDRVFGDADIEMARSTKRFLDAGLTEEAIAEMTRVLGEAMARLTATMAAHFVQAFLRAGDSEYDVARRFADLAGEFTPAVHPILGAAYNRHLRDGVRRGVIGRAEREAGTLADAQELSVAFADLVGFTRMGVEIEAGELGSVAGRFAEIANDVTSSPVRLIKTIGDAAMFVSPEPSPLVAVALRLVARVKESELPDVRVGIAYGPTLARAGDFYGHSVNLASRVTGLARPGSVLCTQEIHAAAEDDFHWSFAGKHRVKGVKGSLALHRARPREDDTPDDGAGDGDA